MNYKNKSFMSKKKAFTLIELLIVIAIIGILFIVLVSKVDFATDKAKATGVQTDFRSFQMAFDTVAKENAGFNTFGWDTGDANQNGKRDSYDEGDNGAGGGTAKNGIQDGAEVFTGHKVYAETFTKVYSLKKNGTGSYDRDALNRLETAINANLDPKLHITIKDDGEIVMANGAQDPWNKEYHGYYISNAETDGKDRGAIVLYSDGANNEFGSEHAIANGVVSVTVPNSNKYGKDDYSIVSVYTYVNGYGEVKNITTGFSNNQTMLTGNNGGMVVTPNVPETPDEPIQPDEPNLPVNGVYEMLDGKDQTFDAATSTDLSFRSKADFNKFSGVKVDGVSVASTNYTVSEGSTIVTLKADYLKTLDAGEHYVEIISNDGIAKTEFTINQAPINSQQYKLNGSWTFNSYLVAPSTVINENIAFKVVGNQDYVYDAIKIGIFKEPTINGTMSPEASVTYYRDGTSVVSTYYFTSPAKWMDELPQTIIFEGEQVVSEEFYNWFVNNATVSQSNRIVFTINNVEYYAEEGMTWGDFRRSGLNVEQGGPVSEDSPPLEYISDTVPVYNPGCFGILYNGVQVVYGDIIVAGGAYISDNPHKY